MLKRLYLFEKQHWSLVQDVTKVCLKGFHIFSYYCLKERFTRLNNFIRHTLLKP